jgi:hypothetical protein
MQKGRTLRQKTCNYYAFSLSMEAGNRSFEEKNNAERQEQVSVSGSVVDVHLGSLQEVSVSQSMYQQYHGVMELIGILGMQ